MAGVKGDHFLHGRGVEGLPKGEPETTFVRLLMETRRVISAQ